MSQDISTEFNKEQEKKCGRRGYVAWKNDKQLNISPRDYGMFIQDKKRTKKNR